MPWKISKVLKLCAESNVWEKKTNLKTILSTRLSPEIWEMSDLMGLIIWSNKKKK